MLLDLKKKYFSDGSGGPIPPQPKISQDLKCRSLNSRTGSSHKSPHPRFLTFIKTRVKPTKPLTRGLAGGALSPMAFSSRCLRGDPGDTLSSSQSSEGLECEL